ncbi:class II aldolase/adducin family protein [Ramlibacter sp. AW1]|uniref:Class II aldolase/adducin family protein n=1 Tax=Ramlibacter aurantiacus TaxID=2801330 RepID=A0A936ZJA7_9BURK|nr:class II aldolase/adducin family protein [Ramlibacter aurantiacus]MBL0421947.1 class II aldolase/adducin family protein [Ramlibacter aurantiacus]
MNIPTPERDFTQQAQDLAADGHQPDTNLIGDLVTANHILFDQGVLDSFGHVSVRDSRRPDRFLLARNMAPGLVGAADIIQFDLDGQPVDAAGRGIYLERFIHGEIYKARPDVMAVVHSHSPAVVPFSVSKTSTLRATCHMAGFIGLGTPIFEIRKYAGDTNSLLITDNELGRGLAEVLGQRSLVLMRGHGSTVVADDLKRAVYRAVYTEVNAKIQSSAMALGEVEFLSEGEIAETVRVIETQVMRAWNFWKLKATATARAFAEQQQAMQQP